MLFSFISVYSAFSKSHPRGSGNYGDGALMVFDIYFQKVKHLDCLLNARMFLSDRLSRLVGPGKMLDYQSPQLLVAKFY